MANSSLLAGVVIGAAAAIAARAVFKSLPGSDAVARALGRSALVLSEKSREAVAELGEVVEDVAAELNAAHASQVNPPSSSIDDDAEPMGEGRGADEDV